MSIVCNTRCLNATLTGTQRYTQQILNAFPETIEQLQPSAKLSRGVKGHLWEQFVLPAKLNNKLLWSPSNSGPLGVSRQVVTIHDLVTVDHPEWFNKKFTQWSNYMLPRLCKKADHIITISEFSRQRILELFKLPDSKVSMIYNGGALSFSNVNSEPMKLPFKKYILSLGSLEPRKNIPLLLNCWQNVLPHIPDDTGLVIVGAIGNERIFKNTGIANLPNRVFFTGHIKDEFINQLYANALFFVYLSVYEGFGLPPLEAMALGTPVLTGNLTALPEVVGEGGILVDPFSAAECQEGLLRLIVDNELRNALSAKAILQAQKFDWNKTAQYTWNILQRFN